MSIEELETLRKKAKNKFMRGIWISLGLSILSVIITETPFLVFFIIIIGMIITMVANRKPTKEFTLAFKKTFVEKSLQTVFTDLTYEPEKGLDYSVIRNTGMMDIIKRLYIRKV